MGVRDPQRQEQIKELLGLSPDEPIFIIRGRDRLAIGNINDYKLKAERAGCSPTFLEDLRQKQSEFEQYYVTHSDQMKRPD